MAGPQAREGVAQLRGKSVNAQDVIAEMRDIQHREFSRLGIPFNNLFGRDLTMIDCQNLFCEFTKYIKLSGRVAAGGLVYNKDSAKKRFRKYEPSMRGPLKLWFPNKWGINLDIPANRRQYEIV